MSVELISEKHQSTQDCAHRSSERSLDCTRGRCTAFCIWASRSCLLLCMCFSLSRMATKVHWSNRDPNPVSSENHNLDTKLWPTYTGVQLIRPYRVRMEIWTYSSASFLASRCSLIRLSYTVYWQNQEAAQPAWREQSSTSKRRSERISLQIGASICSTV